jgi:hypothetical protein
MKYTIINTQDTKAGKDVTVRFVDATNEIDVTRRFAWNEESEPTLVNMDDRLSHIGGKILAKHQNPPKSPELNRNDVEQALKDKGLLDTDKAWEDFLTAQT